jgi:hypothetical protein
VSFEDWMSTAAVLVTLFGATIAYVQYRAITVATEAGSEGQQYGIEAVQVRTLSEQAAQLQFARYQLLEAERRRLGNAWQAHLLGDAGADRAMRRWRDVSHATEVETLELAAAQSQAVTQATFLPASDRATYPLVCPITPLDEAPPPGCTLSDSPDGDAAFPRAYFADANWPAERLTALRAEASVRASTKGREVSAYVVTLSAFTIAIFLFGFALNRAVKDRAFPRVGLVTGACLLVAASVGYSAWGYAKFHSSPSTTSTDASAAAASYADGVTALTRGDRRTARIALKRAIALSGGRFARAYYELGLATADPGAQATEYHRAVKYGVDLTDAASRLATAETMLAIQTGGRRGVGDAERDTRDAQSKDKANPVPYLDEGLLLVAEGRLEPAEAKLRAGIATARRQPIGDVALEREISDVLTELRRLRANGRLDDQALERAEGTLVRGLGPPPRVPRKPTPMVAHSLHAAVNPGAASWWASDGAVPAVGTGQLVLQWYYRSNPRGTWTSVPELSGIVKNLNTAHGRVGATTSYVAATTRQSAPSCLAPGQYQAEIYNDGELLGRTVAELDGPPARAVFVREMNVALCVPRGWTRRLTTPTSPHFIAPFPAMIVGWASPSHVQGVLVLRLNGQFPLRAVSGHESHQVMAVAATKAMRIWHRTLPPALRAHGQWRPGNLPVGFAVEPGIRRDFRYHSGVGGGRQSGTLEVEVTFNKNDVAYVATIFGPESMRHERTKLRNSITSALF